MLSERDLKTTGERRLVWRSLNATVDEAEQYPRVTD
jgi:hypothetical protein